MKYLLLFLLCYQNLNALEVEKTQPKDLFLQIEEEILKKISDDDDWLIVENKEAHKVIDYYKDIFENIKKKNSEYAFVYLVKEDVDGSNLNKLAILVNKININKKMPYIKEPILWIIKNAKYELFKFLIKNTKSSAEDYSNYREIVAERLKSTTNELHIVQLEKIQSLIWKSIKESIVYND